MSTVTVYRAITISTAGDQVSSVTKENRPQFPIYEQKNAINCCMYHVAPNGPLGDNRMRSGSIQVFPSYSYFRFREWVDWWPRFIIHFLSL